MKPEQQQKLRLLTRKYNIHFQGPVERKAWPSSFENIFLDIQTLGAVVFDEYCESSVIDSLNKPWKASARRRAKRMAALADLCRREQRNEAGWRMVVEPEVMARFTVEVACPQCRKRLWRSEIEVTLDDKDAALESLERRRKAREPCTCISVSRGEDCFDTGLNPLFSDRAQEVIIHDTVLRSALSKQEQPDRVYGLRSTHNFEILLDALTNRTESHFAQEDDTKDLKFSPFRQDGDPLLFPFLILEAKSEKGPKSFGAIEKQTAFSIRTLLQMQANLHHTVGARSTCLGGPLVWFFASKGEEWRVSACYVDALEQASHYYIIDIWDGRITRLDDALRLLLIVDYIFDWARDLYRPTILHDLKAAVGCDNASLVKDSDIMSAMNEIRSSLNQPQYEDDSVLEIRNERDSGIPQSLLALDSEHGVIRHASFIQSLLLGLYVTSDNLDSLLQSFSTTSKAQKFARDILKAMKICWRTTADTLDAIETRWTGHQRRPEESLDPQMMFYVAFALTAYMSPLWDQVREFSYLAISEDAIDLLLIHADFSQTMKILPQEYPNVGLQALESFCDRVQSASITGNLYATMSTASLAGKMAHQDYPREWTVQEVTGSIPGFIPDDDGQTRRLVSTIYSLHKIGRKEPSEPFLRISKRHDKQSEDRSSSFVWSLPKTSPEVSTETTTRFGDGVLLTCTSSGAAFGKVSTQCCCIVNGNSEMSDAWNMLQILRNAASEGSIYVINCRDLKPELPRAQYSYNNTVTRSRAWPLFREKFRKWLGYLTDIAKRTTSPRISSPVQMPPSFEAVHDTSRYATSSANGTPRETTEPASASSVGVGPVQVTGSRKRHSDVIVINDDDDTDSRPSKRQERTFDSDYLPDELLQELLDEQHFGEASSRDEVELRE